MPTQWRSNDPRCFDRRGPAAGQPGAVAAGDSNRICNRVSRAHHILRRHLRALGHQRGASKHWGISAAHPWLPCGTPVRVSHRGRVLTVRVTDRCDCSSLDLSAGAAHRLGVPLDGIATVHISHQ